jgi:hypothetical protein
MPGTAIGTFYLDVLNGRVAPLDNIEAYRQSASQCLALSRKAGDPADRELLVAMAQRWLQLAGRADQFTGQTKLGNTGNVSDAAITDPLAEARQSAH